MLSVCRPSQRVVTEALGGPLADSWSIHYTDMSPSPSAAGYLLKPRPHWLSFQCALQQRTYDDGCSGDLRGTPLQIGGLIGNSVSSTFAASSAIVNGFFTTRCSEGSSFVGPTYPVI